MCYHWMEDGSVISSRELAERIRSTLAYLDPSDPEREIQKDLLRDLSEEYPEDMAVFDVMVLDEGNLIRHEYYTGWFQEDAEQRARDMREEERATYPGAYWQVLRIKN